jgi:cell pole-organizing protein PopZ
MGSTNLRVNEPSMEDILASIRRIISEDHEPAFREPESSPLKTVLDLAERHLAAGLPPEILPDGAEEQRPLVQEASSQEESFIARSTESYEAVEPVRSSASTMTPAAQAFAQPCERNPGEALMSRATEASVSEAFGRLNEVRAANRSQTVEDLMKEMLRPMLKAWLDDHLPALVERLVQAEIQRVTRG